MYESVEDSAWGAHSPDVDGVFAVGRSRAELESRMADALAAHLAHVRESDRPLSNRTPTPGESPPSLRWRRRQAAAGEG